MKTDHGDAFRNSGGAGILPPPPESAPAASRLHSWGCRERYGTRGRSRSAEPGSRFGEHPLICNDGVIDGGVGGQVVVLVSELPVEPTREAAHQLFDASSAS